MSGCTTKLLVQKLVIQKEMQHIINVRSLMDTNSPLAKGAGGLILLNVIFSINYYRNIC